MFRANETETETGVLCLICIIHKTTPETETPLIRSRRDLKRCCTVSPYGFMTTTVSKGKRPKRKLWSLCYFASQTWTRRPEAVYKTTTRSLVAEAGSRVLSILRLKGKILSNS